MNTRVLAVVCGLVLATVACSGDDDDTSELCHDGCVATLKADCSAGPRDQASCENDCKALQTSKCTAEYAALQNCGKSKPVSCDADGRPSVNACSSEVSKFVSCLTS